MSTAVPGTEAMLALISQHLLQPHFQPIVRLANGELLAHEALVRPPPTSPWPQPDALFAAGRAMGLTQRLELACLQQALDRWEALGTPGTLFVNLSAGAVLAGLEGLKPSLSQRLAGWAVRHPLVIEITEHEQVTEVDRLVRAVALLRRQGLQIALDDFGDGRSSLRLWSELKPEYVKIDKYFTRDVAHTAEKVQTFRALRQISETFGSQLIVEGVENDADLHVLRDLGMAHGQGWLFGRPRPEPVVRLPEPIEALLRSADVAVIPERRRTHQSRATALSMLYEVPVVEPGCSNQDVFERFVEDEALVAVVVGTREAPLGLIGRQRFMDRFLKPYFRELYGRQPCEAFANLAPARVDLHADLDELAAVLTSQDQRYLSDGFLITESGGLRGVGRGDDLVRAVTEARIEAARHANPLTLLPGNIPLTLHIQRLQAAGREFVACYCDLNHFKPFNDLYGYWRGDEMILLMARCLTAVADPRRDFVGHVGGDDFVVLFQSADWDTRCRQAIASFNQAAATLYDDAARQAGGVQAEDRFGVQRFHPLTTVSVGAVIVRPDQVCGHAPEAVADAAAQAKRAAKHGAESLVVLSLEQVARDLRPLHGQAAEAARVAGPLRDAEPAPSRRWPARRDSNPRPAA